MYQCEKCGEPLGQCVCPDPPVEEKAEFFWNRAGEELLRWLRVWNIIK